MGLITPDLSGIKDPLDAGTYNARIIGYGQKDGDDATKEINWEKNGEAHSLTMLVARLEVFGAENAAHNGMTVAHELPLSGGGAFRLTEFYEAATGTIVAKEQREGFSFDTDELMGRDVTIVVIKEADKNDPSKEYTRVKSVSKIA